MRGRYDSFLAAAAPHLLTPLVFHGTLSPLRSCFPPRRESAAEVHAGKQYTGPMHHRWSPYEMNGGSVVAIAGDDFAIIAADTRLSVGYSILSRNVSKLHKLGPQTVVGTGGCYTDISTLHKTLDIRCKMYKHSHEEHMSTEATAQLLSNTLYYRRFFPYYAFNIVAGLDAEGKGAVYGYDAVGSYQRQPDNAVAEGSSSALIMPVLDNTMGWKNREDAKMDITLDSALELLKECFVTAGERDIYCGDSVEIKIIQKSGITTEVFNLKKD